jgi:hypothetical protein
MHPPRAGGKLNLPPGRACRWRPKRSGARRAIGFEDDRTAFLLSSPRGMHAGGNPSWVCWRRWASPEGGSGHQRGLVRWRWVREGPAAPPDRTGAYPRGPTVGSSSAGPPGRRPVGGVYGRLWAEEWQG